MRITKLFVVFLLIFVSSCRHSVRPSSTAGGAIINKAWIEVPENPLAIQGTLVFARDGVEREPCGPYFMKVGTELYLTRYIKEDVAVNGPIRLSSTAIFVNNKHKNKPTVQVFDLGTNSTTGETIRGGYLRLDEKDYKNSPCLPPPESGQDPKTIKGARIQ